MRRRLFSIVSVLSLLLCSATAVLWVRHRDSLLFCLRDGRVWSIYSRDGAVRVVTAPGWEHPAIWQVNRSGPGSWGFDEFRSIATASESSFCGLNLWCVLAEVQVRKDIPINPLDPDVQWFIGYTPVPIRTLEVPYWMLLVAGLIVPGTKSLHCLAGWASRRRRAKRGRCRTCSYSLVGNISGVCPECGTPVTVG